MVRVSDLVHSGFRIEWHEAVALVQAVGDRCGQLGTRVPTLEALVLSPDGEVSEGAQTYCQVPLVPALASHLKALLEGASVPVELGQILDDWEVSRDERAEDLDGFSRALSYFERPGRAEVLRHLAARADIVGEQRAARELDHLTTRARLQAKAAPVAPPVAVQRRPWLRALLVFVSVVALLAVALGLFVWFWPEAAKQATQASRQAVTEGAGRVGQAVRTGLTALLPAPADAPAPTDPAPAPKPTGGRDRRAALSPLPDLVVHVSEQELAALEAPAVTETPEQFAAPPVEEAARTPDPSVVYDASDQDVDPPVLDRPALPTSEPGEATSRELGLLELLVGADGRVERVRHVTPPMSFHERMLISAAKAWRFRPARKDGLPVRYLAVVRITR